MTSLSSLAPLGEVHSGLTSLLYIHVVLELQNQFRQLSALQIWLQMICVMTFQLCPQPLILYHLMMIPPRKMSHHPLCHPNPVVFSSCSLETELGKQRKAPED
uniref:Uncharacterized protein n=1 Tax=Opuntia streptacantha TaxID=393608 RepID=A0A7C9DMT8_OPUST